jgi:protein-S-isoprenylcysteine O-methyltransferase Ste14
VADLAATLARRRVPLGFICGLAVLWLAQPTWFTLAAGGAVAALGEAIRVWAAGHLEKGSEVTRSGPYRITRHPLYAGSAIVAAGAAVAAARGSVALIIGVYMVVTMAAAIRHEEANMRAAFGPQYDAYLTSRAPAAHRGFSVKRALWNREHRTVMGLLIVAVIFAIKAARH